LLILIGNRLYPTGGNDGKKDLENADRKAPGENRVSLWSLLSFDSGIHQKFNFTRRRGVMQ
jgi:hypothetical protein